MDLSFSLAPSDALNQVVQSAIDAGISVTTAAEDDSADAGGYFKGLIMLVPPTWAISTLATLCAFFILHMA